MSLFLAGSIGYFRGVVKSVAVKPVRDVLILPALLNDSVFGSNSSSCVPLLVPVLSTTPPAMKACPSSAVPVPVISVPAGTSRFSRGFEGVK